VLGAVNAHTDGPLIMAEHTAPNTVLQHKALFVRIIVNLLIDNNGNIMQMFSAVIQDSNAVTAAEKLQDMLVSEPDSS